MLYSDATSIIDQSDRYTNISRDDGIFNVHHMFYFDGFVLYLEQMLYTKCKDTSDDIKIMINKVIIENYTCDYLMDIDDLVIDTLSDLNYQFDVVDSILLDIERLIKVIGKGYDESKVNDIVNGIEDILSEEKNKEDIHDNIVNVLSDYKPMGINWVYGWRDYKVKRDNKYKDYTLTLVGTEYVPSLT